MKMDVFKATVAAAIGALVAYGVQLFIPCIVLVVVMLLDYITGMVKAWEAGELSSKVGIKGILKKLGYLVIVSVAGVVDWCVRYGVESAGMEWKFEFLFASIVLLWLVINELISILENVSAIGVPVPAFLTKIIGKLKTNTENKVGDNEDENH
jgi:toxin secretion/phage lysis holin